MLVAFDEEDDERIALGKALQSLISCALIFLDQVGFPQFDERPFQKVVVSVF